MGCGGCHALYLTKKLHLLESSSTFRAEFKLLVRLESAVTTSLESAFVSRLHLRQILLQYFYILASCDSFSNFRIKRINRITACALYIVLPVPFKAWDKKYGQAHISHKDLISAVRATMIADEHLIIFKKFFPLSNSHHEKHFNYSPNIFLYHRYSICNQVI